MMIVWSGRAMAIQRCHGGVLDVPLRGDESNVRMVRLIDRGGRSERCGAGARLFGARGASQPAAFRGMDWGRWGTVVDLHVGGPDWEVHDVRCKLKAQGHSNCEMPRRLGIILVRVQNETNDPGPGANAAYSVAICRQPRMARFQSADDPGHF